MLWLPSPGWDRAAHPQGEPGHSSLPRDSPCPEGGRWEEPLDEGGLVGIEAQQVAGAVDADEDTEDIEGPVAPGEVTGPPRAQPHEDQEVDAGGGGGQGDPWGAAPRGQSVHSPLD